MSTEPISQLEYDSRFGPWSPLAYTVDSAQESENTSRFLGCENGWFGIWAGPVRRYGPKHATPTVSDVYDSLIS